MGARRLIPLALAAVAVLLAASDTYVVVLALPDVMVGVGLDVDELQRAAPIVSVFLLGYVAMLPLIGRLADLSGRRPVLVGCLLVFSAGSLVTAVSADLTTVVVGRFLQGVGGGGLVPTTLALVADLWPPHRRGVPLGVVGAVQELGTVVGPLAGAAVLVVADWRMIFWLNLLVGLVLAAGLAATRPVTGGRARPALRTDPLGAGLVAVAAAAAALALIRPRPLVESLTWGTLFVPAVDERSATAPVALLALAAGGLLLLREAAAAAPLLPVRRARRLAGRVDLPGALLVAVALGGVVLAFATADPAVQALSSAAPPLLAVAAAAAVGAWLRQRTAADPLIPLGALRARGAWGALLVSVFLGAALIAPLVQVPVYARTALTGETQLDAALELLRLLVGLPVGALAGGWLLHRTRAPVAAAGLLLASVGLAHMATWDLATIAGPVDDTVLVLTGLGFGLAVAPVNAALLGATTAEVHGRASALLVVARTVGKLVGLSALTTVGLRRFYAVQEGRAAPATLCPGSPLDCPAYSAALREAVLAQVHATLAGAAVCAAVAAALALVLLRARPAGVDPAGLLAAGPA